MSKNTAHLILKYSVMKFLTVPFSHHRSDVAGLDMAKEALKEAVIMPVRFPHMFQGLAIFKQFCAS